MCGQINLVLNVTSLKYIVDPIMDRDWTLFIFIIRFGLLSSFSFKVINRALLFLSLFFGKKKDCQLFYSDRFHKSVSMPS